MYIMYVCMYVCALCIHGYIFMNLSLCMYICMYLCMTMYILYMHLGYNAIVAIHGNCFRYPGCLVSSEHRRPGVCVLPIGYAATQRNYELRAPCEAPTRWGAPQWKLLPPATEWLGFFRVQCCANPT